MKERFTVLWRRTGRSPCPYRSSDTDRSLPDLLREIVPLLKENGVSVEVTRAARAYIPSGRQSSRASSTAFLKMISGTT